MSTDILTRLRQLAPDPVDLDRRWPVDARAELVRQILSEQVGTRARLRHRARPRGRRLAAYVLAAAVAAVLAGPAVLPQGTPGAASPAAADALHRLADVAARTPADTLRPGQFVFTLTRSYQVGVPENPELGPVVYDTRIESWTAYDGRTWTRSSSVGDPEPRSLYTPAYAESGAAYFASLPTDADELGRLLRETVRGSSSQDEAVFLAVGDLMASDTAPAALRAAAASVLAATDHVRLGPARTDELGRDVTQFDFVDESIRPGMVQSFFVERRTAQTVGRRTTQDGSTYSGTLLTSEVVDDVPTSVVRTACPVNGPAGPC